jgi:nucleoside-diphosphate-sugar epimerase
MQTVLITGHLGFIGTTLKKSLEHEYNIIGLDIKDGNDILDCDLPDCDIVIHLAAKSGVRQSLLEPAEYWRVNVEGTKRILQHYSNKRILVASSSSQYEPFLNPYAASKYVMESIPHSNVCWMRFHTVYSLEPRANMFLSKLINNTLEYVTTHERDFIHVDDICRAIKILLDTGYQGPVDIGTGKTIKINSICPNLPIEHNTPHERSITKADTAIIKSLGFNNLFDIEDFLLNKLRR